jgi:ATP-dependent DNA helicase RecG
MTSLQLEEVLRRGETDTVEFKRCGGQPERDVFETICSFSNRNGGSLYLGVLDDGTVAGVPEAGLMGIKRNIVNVLNNEAAFDPTAVVEFEEIAIQGKTVLRVWVPPSSAIHRYKGVTYDRLWDADVRVKSADALAMMCLCKQNIYTEQRVYPYLTESDLDLGRMGDFRRRAYAKRANHPWKLMSDLEVLRSTKLYAFDYATGKEGFTLAAALILGTDEVIASACPGYRTDVLVRIDDTERYDDRLIVSTNLVDAHQQLFSFITKFLPDRFALESDGDSAPHGVSPRDLIVREVLANSLMHREYISPLIARVIIERDRLTCDNASRARFQGPITPQHLRPMPKNPVIGKFFNQIGLSEELGSGVPALFRYSKAYSGEEPLIEEGDVFRTVIPLKPLGGGENTVRASDPQSEVPHSQNVAEEPLVEKIFDLLDASGSVKTSEVVATTGVSARTVQRTLADLVSQGALVAEGATRGRRYRRPE